MAPFDYLRNDLRLTLWIDKRGKVRVREQRGSSRRTAALPLDVGDVLLLEVAYNPAKAADTAAVLLNALATAGVSFEDWLRADDPQVRFVVDPRYPKDPEKRTYSLLRLVLQLDAPELIALPWEAMTGVWGQAGHNTIVVRSVPNPPAVSAAALDLPLTMVQIDESLPAAATGGSAAGGAPGQHLLLPGGGQPESFRLEAAIGDVFKHIERAEVDDIVRVGGVRSWAEAVRLVGPWPKVDVVHLKVREIPEFLAEFPLGPGELIDWLKMHQTRLVVLDVPLARGQRALALSLAHRIAADGGPVILVTSFGEDETSRQSFFSHYYAQIIHDVPLDHAFFVNWTQRDYDRPPPASQPAWLRGNWAQLVSGPGGEELLRITPVLFAAEARRQELEQRASRLHDEGLALAQQVRLLTEGRARGLTEGDKQGLAGQLAASAADVARTRDEIKQMSQEMTFMPTHERRSSAPLVRNRRALGLKDATLTAAGQSFDPALNYLDQNLKRTVNTWLVEGKSVAQGCVLSGRDRLKINTPYLLHVDIGPRTEKTLSVVANPVELEEVVEQIFAIEDAEGVMLEVAVFSDDFWVGPARADPPVAPGQWRRPPADWPEQTITWQRPRRNAVTGHLWLARARPSPALYFSLRPRHPGYGRLHLAIYYRSNLLQSLLFEARVVAAGREDSLDQLPGLGPARQALLAAAGVHTLADLAVAGATRLAEVARTGRTRAEAWSWEAAELPELGNRAFVSYTTSAALTALRDTPRRAVTILTNELRGTHFVGVKAGEWDETQGQGDDYAYGNTLTEAEVKNLVDAVRGDLTAASSLLDPGTRLPIGYSFGPDNAGTSKALARALYRLAVKGYRLYSKFFSAEAQTVLAGLLKEEKQSIHLARVVGNLAVPWSIVYDQYLDEGDRATPKFVCLHALEQLRTGAGSGCGLAARTPGAGDRPEQALQKAARTGDEDRPGYANVDVFFYSDPTVCPKDVHGAQHVVCPWNFWGFKHYLEQPAQQLKAEKPQPRDLQRIVRATPQPHFSVNVFTGLDLWSDHVSNLKALGPAGRPCVVVAAGEDKPDNQNQPRPGRAWVLDALRDTDLAVIYFYCHGGADSQPPEAFLSVGSSEAQQIRPGTLDGEKYGWTIRPLVFVNGCRTVALDPGLFGDFVQKFAEHGAAGVIGTEVSVWEPLAREVAEDFLREFLCGRPVSEILLEIRRKLLGKNNPLGLVYTNYCASDLRLV